LCAILILRRQLSRSDRRYHPPPDQASFTLSSASPPRGALAPIQRLAPSIQHPAFTTLPPPTHNPPRPVPAPTHHGRRHQPHRIRHNDPLGQRKLRRKQRAHLLLPRIRILKFHTPDPLQATHNMGIAPRRSDKPLLAVCQRAHVGFWRVGRE